MSDVMLSTHDLARRYGVTPYTVRRWRADNEGPPYVKLGDGPRAHVVYRLDDILEWERAHRRRSN